MLYEQKFLLSLLFTLAIELPIVFVLIKYIYKHREINVSTILFTGFVASALTLPYLWFILPGYIFNWGIYIILGESLVILVETIIYYRFLKLKLSESFIISLIANVISALLGMLL